MYVWKIPKAIQKKTTRRLPFLSFFFNDINMSTSGERRERERETAQPTGKRRTRWPTGGVIIFRLTTLFFLCVCAYMLCVSKTSRLDCQAGPLDLLRRNRVWKSRRIKKKLETWGKNQIASSFFFFFFFPPSARHFIFPAFRKAAKRSPVFFTSFIFYLLCHSVRPLLLPPSFLSLSLSLGSHPSQAVFHQTRKWLNFPTTFVIPIVCQLKNEKENLFFFFFLTTRHELWPARFGHPSPNE